MLQWQSLVAGQAAAGPMLATQALSYQFELPESTCLLVF